MACPLRAQGQLGPPGGVFCLSAAPAPLVLPPRTMAFLAGRSIDLNYGHTVEAFGLAGRELCSRITTLAGTDNLGSRFALSKMMTTKCPLVAARMELTWKLHAANFNLDLHWFSDCKLKADALSNCQFNGFDPAKRCRIDMLRTKGKSLHETLRVLDLGPKKLESSRRCALGGKNSEFWPIFRHAGLIWCEYDGFTISEFPA